MKKYVLINKNHLSTDFYKSYYELEYVSHKCSNGILYVPDVHYDDIIRNKYVFITNKILFSHIKSIKDNIKIISVDGKISSYLFETLWYSELSEKELIKFLLKSEDVVEK